MRRRPGHEPKSHPHTSSYTQKLPRATAWIGRSWRASARWSATTGATPTPLARGRARSTRPERAVRCSSWRRPGRQYGVDGDGDGRADRWDPADAIFSMANYLRASGAPGDYRKAIFAYNHADWYVARGGALGLALPRLPPRRAPRAGRKSRSPTWPGVGEVEFTSGAHAVLSPNDGHVALVPAGRPAWCRRW